MKISKRNKVPQEPKQLTRAPVIGMMSAVPICVEAINEGGTYVDTNMSLVGSEAVYSQTDGKIGEDLDHFVDCYIDVPKLVQEFEDVTKQDDVLIFLRRWGAFMPPEPSEDGADLPLKLMFPYSCFVAWQDWFSMVRTGSGTMNVPIDLRDSLFPPEYMPITRRRIALLYSSVETHVFDTPNHKCPYTIGISATGIVEILRAVCFAERLAEVRRVRCKGCRRTFIPDAQRTTFHDTVCGRNYHKRIWARTEAQKKRDRLKDS